jgi:hypothetical protein
MDLARAAVCDRILRSCPGDLKENAMHPSNTCQSCRRPPGEGLLSYRKGPDVVRNDAMLQCDVCERYACAECLQVYDIFSGYDFLCHECARGFSALLPAHRGH